MRTMSRSNSAYAKLHDAHKVARVFISTDTSTAPTLTPEPHPSAPHGNAVPE